MDGKHAWTENTKGLSASRVGSHTWYCLPQGPQTVRLEQKWSKGLLNPAVGDVCGRIKIPASIDQISEFATLTFERFGAFRLN
jgi:hypothetical protein